MCVRGVKYPTIKWKRFSTGVTSYPRYTVLFSPQVKKNVITHCMCAHAPPFSDFTVCVCVNKAPPGSDWEM